MTTSNPQEDTEVLNKKKTQLRRPRRFRVLLHNDDYTTMEFVVFVLERVFRKPPAEAEQIMLSVHRTGKGIAGLYTRDVAETKVAQAKELAEAEGYPLLCTAEPE